MKKRYTKEDFKKLNFDEKCTILGNLMPDEYYGGQTEINFWLPDDIDEVDYKILPPTPPDIEKEEDRKFKQLIDDLTEKLFSESEFIEFDLEALNEENV